jgi:hypothetical protein
MNAEYEAGYEDGMAGRACAVQGSTAYVDGWYDGEADRPTLDELTLDVDKERVDPFGY